MREHNATKPYPNSWITPEEIEQQVDAQRAAGITYSTLRKIETKKLLQAVTMPCGRYQGWSLGDVPGGYRRWVADNFTDDYIRACARAIEFGDPTPESLQSQIDTLFPS